MLPYKRTEPLVWNESTTVHVRTTAFTVEIILHYSNKTDTCLTMTVWTTDFTMEILHYSNKTDTILRWQNSLWKFCIVAIRLIHIYTCMCLMMKVSTTEFTMEILHYSNKTNTCLTMMFVYVSAQIKSIHVLYLTYSRYPYIKVALHVRQHSRSGFDLPEITLLNWPNVDPSCAETHRVEDRSL